MRVLLFVICVLCLFELANGGCSVTASTKIPKKCNKLLDLIQKQFIKTKNIIEKKVMWAFAEGLGTYGLSWIQKRLTALNKAVPTMCEVGGMVTEYATDNLDTLVGCTTEYNPGTAAKVAVDAMALTTLVAVNRFNLQTIGNSMICALLECLKGAYKNQFTPKYKKWIKKLNQTVVMTNVCAMGVQYLQTQKLVQTCFNAAKARTQVVVMQKLFDPYVPKYAAMYQTYRDKSTVACMTKPQICDCNINLTESINAASGLGK